MRKQQLTYDPLEIPLATPLAAYIRVPLSWFHSITYAFFPDETHSLIRRVYTHPSHSHAKRQFCGYCGTPLSYWSEKPPTEAEYIHLTLGSLLREDLRDLEDMGLIPDPSEASETEDAGDEAEAGTASSRPSRTTALRESYGVPWFDGLVEGTRLGKMRQSRGVERSHDGRINIQWEVVEIGNDGEAEEDQDVDMGTLTPAKRKRDSSDAVATGSNEQA